ncbi:hypothetical protein [Terribacillus saccharophilus]|nr:hypothetical protein [Terribacillus saccharophilus]
MYEIMDYRFLEIVLTYVVFLSACLLTYPVVRLIITAVKEGASKWR